MDKKLTILLTCYNKEKYISYILFCLKAQNNPQVDIHIIDDGSTDNSLNIIKEISADEDNFYIHHWRKNKGTGYTRNFALSLVKTDYFIFIDADDMITENYVEKILEYIEEDSTVDVHHFRTRLYPMGPVCIYSFSLWDRVINKKFLDKHNITFNSQLTNMEDWNLYVRMNKIGFQEKQHDEVLYIYNLLAEDTITHDKPIWYNHNLDGIRPESAVDYCQEYNQ